MYKQRRLAILLPKTVIPRYLRGFGKGIRKRLPHINLATIIDFFRFFVRISEGRIDESGLNSVDSVCTNADFFFAQLQYPDAPFNKPLENLQADMTKETAARNAKRPNRKFSSTLAMAN